MEGIDYIAKLGYKNEVWWYIIKREVFNDIGIRFIEGRWMEDAIFTATLFLKIKVMAHIPLDVHRHVKTLGSAMTSKEPSHYLKVIYDNENAALAYKPLIDNICNNSQINNECIQRLKARQQSFVFFLLIRILKSTMKLRDVKVIIDNMEEINAYPLKSFIGKDYNLNIYLILVKLLNNRYIYYTLYYICNPLYRLKNKISKV
jgi:hypothetical protein